MTTRANLYVDQGVDFLVTLELETDSGADYPIDDQVFYCQARRVYSSNAIFDATMTVVQDDDSNKLNMYIDPQLTLDAKPGKYHYDIVMRNTTSNEVTKILEGLLFILPTTTRSQFADD